MKDRGIIKMNNRRKAQGRRRKAEYSADPLPGEPAPPQRGARGGLFGKCITVNPITI